MTELREAAILGNQSSEPTNAYFLTADPWASPPIKLSDEAAH